MKYIFVLLMMGLSLFADTLGWSNNYQETLQKAQEQNKNVYMLITSQDCRWCRKFEATTLQKEAVQARLYNDYVVVHIDRDLHPLPSKFKVAPIPRHYIVKADGTIIDTFIGYWEQADFFSYLDDAQRRLEKILKLEEK